MASYASHNNYLEHVLLRIRDIAATKRGAAWRRIAELASEALRTFEGGQ